MRRQPLQFLLQADISTSVTSTNLVVYLEKFDGGCFTRTCTTDVADNICWKNSGLLVNNYILLIWQSYSVTRVSGLENLKNNCSADIPPDLCQPMHIRESNWQKSDELFLGILILFNLYVQFSSSHRDYKYIWMRWTDQSLIFVVEFDIEVDICT